jgi:hypothetical protein
VDARADLAVVGLYGDHDIACQNCGEAGDLGFRRYRKVIGWIIFDHVENRAGYYCSACRGKLFRRHLALTLVLGWWGVLAALYRNPYAIGVNFRALAGPPRAVERFGAITLNRLDDGEVLATGVIPDTWFCEACSGYFVGFREARDHAARGHPELRRSDARAALKQISGPTY